VELTCLKKKTIILKATDILAVQMLKFIGSFYWLYKALNTHYEYKSTVHVHVKVPLAIYLTKNKNTILLIIKSFKLVKNI
jgi:hypothetical protein